MKNVWKGYIGHFKQQYQSSEKKTTGEQKIRLSVFSF